MWSGLPEAAVLLAARHELQVGALPRTVLKLSMSLPYPTPPHPTLPYPALPYPILPYLPSGVATPPPVQLTQPAGARRRSRGRRRRRSAAPRPRGRGSLKRPKTGGSWMGSLRISEFYPSQALWQMQTSNNSNMCSHVKGKTRIQTTYPSTNYPFVWFGFMKNERACKMLRTFISMLKDKRACKILRTSISMLTDKRACKILRERERETERERDAGCPNKLVRAPWRGGARR